MLIRFSASNVFSFYKETELNLLPNPKKIKLSHHIYTNHQLPLLKQSALYGANGSGKSNLLKAMQLLKRVVTNKDLLDEQYVAECKFKLAGAENYNPIIFNVEFIYDTIPFFYSIHLDESGIVQEELYISGLGKNEDIPIFKYKKREESLSLEFYDENGNPRGIESEESVYKLIKRNPYSSLLSLNNEFPVIFSENAEKAYSWFDDRLKVVPLNFAPPRFFELVEQLDKSEDLLKFSSSVLKKIDIGIENLEVRKKLLSDVFSEEEKDVEIRNSIIEDLKESTNKIGLDTRGSKYIITKENNQEVVKELLFTQEGLNGFSGTMTTNQQSDGTLRLLTYIPMMKKLLDSPVVYLVDEIENSIHPMLIKAFLKLFTENPKSQGQLIYTTHECHLLSQKDIRSDEVWFCQKDKGATNLYSLNDFKEHDTINIEKGYLAGRYGAIPYLGNLEELTD